MTLKVIQWATGKVGQRAARAIIDDPGLELVGVHAFSPDKVGRDVGELCGTDETGVLATDDIELPFMTFPKGTVAGQRSTWHGMAGGRPVISLRIVWQMGGDLDPGWPLGRGYRIEIEGDPAISTRFELKQPARAGLSREPHSMGLAWVATAMPAVNAIPAVCRAAPGVCSYLDLPPICAADLVRLA